MYLARVKGTVVSGKETAETVGLKLKIVEILDGDHNPAGRFDFVFDGVGAGTDETVLVAGGSSARLTEITKDKPADKTIMAIVDNIHEGGRKISL